MWYAWTCRYVGFLLEALKRQELFSWIVLVPDSWWHSLLWRDAYNFLGVRASLPEDLQKQLTEKPDTLSQVTHKPLADFQSLTHVLGTNEADRRRASAWRLS